MKLDRKTIVATAERMVECAHELRKLRIIMEQYENEQAKEQKDAGICIRCETMVLRQDSGQN